MLEEVTYAIRSTKPMKAPGLLGIPTFILQQALPALKTQFVQLFQACLDLGYYPIAFKTANTIILQKLDKDDYSQPKSYRLIALLDTLGKALEKIVAKRLADLAEHSALLPAYQMGARRGRDTISALELLVEQTHTIWKSGNKQVASMLSLDMARAFDNASYPRLLYIL